MVTVRKTGISALAVYSKTAALIHNLHFFLMQKAIGTHK